MNKHLANQGTGCGCLGWLGGFICLFLFWPLGVALIIVSLLLQILSGQRRGSERAAMAVADAEAMRLWEERSRRKKRSSENRADDPLYRAARKLFHTLQEALAAGERLPVGQARARRAKEAQALLDELLVLCESISFLSETDADELDERLQMLSDPGEGLALHCDDPDSFQ